MDQWGNLKNIVKSLDTSNYDVLASWLVAPAVKGGSSQTKILIDRIKSCVLLFSKNQWTWSVSRQNLSTPSDLCKTIKVFKTESSLLIGWGGFESWVFRRVMSSVSPHDRLALKRLTSDWPSVDWLVGRCRARRSLPDADPESAKQQEDHGSAQTDGHDGDDQWWERVNRRRTDADQNRPEGNARRRKGEINSQVCSDRQNQWNKAADQPAQVFGVVVERISWQAKAHVQSKWFWFWVECPDQTGRCRHHLTILRPRVRMATRRGVLQRRVSLTVRHRLPLNKTQNIRAAIRRRDPLRHLRGQRSTGRFVFKKSVSLVVLQLWRTWPVTRVSNSSN